MKKKKISCDVLGGRPILQIYHLSSFLGKSPGTENEGERNHPSFVIFCNLISQMYFMILAATDILLCTHLGMTH